MNFSGIFNQNQLLKLSSWVRGLLQSFKNRNGKEGLLSHTWTNETCEGKKWRRNLVALFARVQYVKIKNSACEEKLAYLNPLKLFSFCCRAIMNICFCKVKSVCTSILEIWCLTQMVWWKGLEEVLLMMELLVTVHWSATSNGS